MMYPANAGDIASWWLNMSMYIPRNDRSVIPDDCLIVKLVVCFVIYIYTIYVF